MTMPITCIQIHCNWLCAGISSEILWEIPRAVIYWPISFAVPISFAAKLCITENQRPSLGWPARPIPTQTVWEYGTFCSKSCVPKAWDSQAACEYYLSALGASTYPTSDPDLLPTDLETYWWSFMFNHPAEPGNNKTSGVAVIWGGARPRCTDHMISCGPKYSSLKYDNYLAMIGWKSNKVTHAEQEDCSN